MLRPRKTIIAKDPCAQCSKTVSNLHQGVSCDTEGCSHWTHRTCTDPRISLEFYKAAKTAGDLNYTCIKCRECTRRDSIGEPQSPHSAAVSPLISLEPDVSLYHHSTVQNNSSVDASEEVVIPSPRRELSILTNHSHSPNSLAYSPSERPYQEPFVRAGTLISPVHIEREPEDDSDSNVEEVSEYEVIEGGTKQGGVLLVNCGFGYTINKKYTRKDGTIKRFWICSERGCPAKVTEAGGTFAKKGFHNHPKPINLAERMKLIKQIKQSAKENVFESAAAIVSRLRMENGWGDLAMGDVNNLTRIANRSREKERPTHHPLKILRADLA